MTRHDLAEILYQSLLNLGGESDVITVSKYIWEHYQAELERSGDMFYKWQYDLRWAARDLRKQGRIKETEECARGIWVLSE